MLPGMGAKKGRRPPVTPDIQEAIQIHMSASQRRDAILEQAGDLRRDGKIRAAKKLEAEAAELDDRIKALEKEFERTRPGD
jgi:hypothetical protein